ncbi:hypothetical protein BKA65DRAFT_464506 [Rhexocercosporidium sp. MPI-PUGE-AT-0058]|nr:hypothetical protein BKA65DRAFT_464506 [Rhexocercosporidium sp. MPI-PUGE-AT-0058]
MAVNPSQHQTSQLKQRYIPNTPAPLLTLSKPLLSSYLSASLSHILTSCPPVLPWPSLFRGQVYKGFFIGPTSIAYLFYTLSLSPLTCDLLIENKLPLAWSEAYLSLGQEEITPLLEVGCGIANEYLASNALKACVYQDPKYAERVLAALRGLETQKSYCEWLKGRAGALYMLRLMKSGLRLPSLREDIEVMAKELIEDMLPEMPWVWDGRQYLGTVHGEIGILTQIILSDPSYAPRLEGKLRDLLKQQGDDGNWPVIPEKDIGLVQFCHGAPGFLVSLLAIKDYFPGLEREIGGAIEKGRRCIWEKGVLVKEPNVCHGLLGNALALEGERREHFLGLGTPEEVRKGLEGGKWVKDEDPFGMLWGESGRAWVYAWAWEESEGLHEKGGIGKVPLYTDV